MFILRIILLQVSFLSVVIGGTCSLQAQNCNLTKYCQAMATADSLIAAGKYVAANDQYNAAKVYCRDRANEVQGKQDELLRSMVGLRAKAEQKTREVLADDLINKSKQQDDRTLAFRLAEQAYYLAPQSPKALQQLHDVHHPGEAWPYTLSIIEEEETFELTFSNDGAVFATFSRNRDEVGSLRLWDTSSGKLLFSLRGDENKRRIYREALGKFSKYRYGRGGIEFAIISDFNSIFPPGYKNGKILFSPDNSKCIAYDELVTEDSIMVWDVQTGNKIYALQQHEEPISALGISQDGKYLSATDRGENVTIWSLNSGEIVSDTLLQKAILNQVVSATQAEIAPNTPFQKGIGGAYAYRSPSAEQVIWQKGKNGDTLYWASLIQEPRAIEFTRDNLSKSSLTVSSDHLSFFYFEKYGGLQIWRFDSLDAISSGPPIYEDGQKAAHFSPDAQYIVSSTRSGYANLWDASSGDFLKGFYIYYLTDAAISPDNKTVVNFSSKKVKAWNVDDEKLRYSLRFENYTVTDAMISPDGTHLLIVADTSFEENIVYGKKGIAFLANLSDGQILDTLRGHESTIKHTSFSKNGDLIATGSTDGSISIWDGKTGKEKSILYVSESEYNERYSITSAIFSPTEDKILSLCNERSPRIWDVNRAEILFELDPGGNDRFYSPYSGVKASYSADGKHIATAGYQSGENIIYIWDASNGEKRLAITHPTYVERLLFHPTLPFLWVFSNGTVYKYWYKGDAIIHETLAKYPLRHLSAQEIDDFEIESSLAYTLFSDESFMTFRSISELHAIWEFYYNQAKDATNASVYAYFAEKANLLQQVLTDKEN